MLKRIFSSTWFAILALLIAAASLGLLYHKGRTTEAMVGAGLLALAALLIYWGAASEE